MKFFTAHPPITTVPTALMQLSWRDAMRAQINLPHSIYSHNTPQDVPAIQENRLNLKQRLLKALEQTPDQISDRDIAIMMIDDFRWDYLARARSYFSSSDTQVVSNKSDSKELTKLAPVKTASKRITGSYWIIEEERTKWIHLYSQNETNAADKCLAFLGLPKRKNNSQVFPDGAMIMAAIDDLAESGDETVIPVLTRLVSGIIGFDEIAKGLFDSQDPDQHFIRPLCVSPLYWYFHGQNGHPYDNILHDLFHIIEASQHINKQPGAEEAKQVRRQQRLIYDAFDLALIENKLTSVSCRVGRIKIDLRDLLLEGETLDSIKKMEGFGVHGASMQIPPQVIRSAYTHLRANLETQIGANDMKRLWGFLNH